MLKEGNVLGYGKEMRKLIRAVNYSTNETVPFSRIFLA